ncbi:hypothetical protein MHIB_00030 [Mycolicibacter hiberniae]|uniref:AMP-dependent synthetase/ligase domain-containing protein n=1 Tax=Mycolicibacter hiberniae TaxID=29314 RepID=A0A7I7WXL6_9MYCO|nr:hypothetical protein MHIB_00030 [Mycolicibacter hiberniae]
MLGDLLTAAGLQTGQVVAAMLPNDAITVAALFGTWLAGGVYTPLNPRAADAELAEQLATLRPVAVVTTGRSAHRFAACGLPVITDNGRPGAVCRRRRPNDPNTTPTSHCCSSPRAPPGSRSRCRGTPRCSISSTAC